MFQVIHSRRLAAQDAFRFSLWLFAVIAFGSSPDMVWAADRVALVIGNSKYMVARPLANARRDAEAVSDKLKVLGFEVVELFDGDGRATSRALANFKTKSASAELSMVYFAGHGLQLFGENFLLASDFDPNRIASREDLGVQLSALVSDLRQSSSKRLIVLIDACRDNPLGTETEAKLLANGARVLGRSVAGAPQKLRQGLAPIEASAEVATGRDAGESLFMFSAQPGRVALDGSGQNSPFAEALLAEMSRTELDVVGVFTEVARYVVETTKGFQRPELRMSWTTSGYRLSPVGQARRAVRYIMSEAKPGDPLYDNNIDKLIQFYRPHHLTGPFNASASLIENISEDNWRYKSRVDQSKFDPQKSGLGYLNGFEFDLDLDGDGVNEGLLVRSGQVGVEFYIRKAGVLHRFEPTCPKHEMSAGAGASPADDDVESVEVSVLDINNNRKADIWIISHRKGGTWPDLCVVEVTGKYRSVATVGWGAVSMVFDPFVVEPLISNSGGWGVNVLPDRTIEICAGSYCANRWTFKWTGKKFEERRDGEFVKEFVRVGWPPEVRAEWSKTLDGAPVTVPAIAKTRSDPLAAIRNYIVDEYLNDREQFADQVDYYDKGVVSREFALADKATYAARWPTRKYELIENSISIFRESRDRTTTSFRYRYAVSRPGKSSNGTGAVQLTLRKVGAQWVVVAVKEVVGQN